MTTSASGTLISRAKTAVSSVFGWRGPDGAGLPLGVWLAFVAVAAVWAKGFSVAEPLAMLVPPFVALAVLIPALQTAVRLARRERGSRLALAIAEPVLVGCFFGVLTWTTWSFVFKQGVFADTFDHHIMIARADEYTARILKGEVPRYSHYAEGGDSLVDLYPSFLNLIALVFRVILPKRVPFETAYTAMVVFAWWFRGMAVYNLSRRYAGPLISLAIATLSLYEVGQDVWDGVWSGALHWGMIHNNVAITISLFAVAFQVDLVRKFSRRAAIGCVATLTLACAAHPLGIIASLLSTACFFFGIVWGKQRRHRPLRALVVSGLGILVAAAWILPFSYAMKHYGFYQPVGGSTYQELGGGLFDGKGPVSSFPALLGFGMIAIIASIASRNTAVAGPGLTALFLWVLALTPFLVTTRFYAYVPSFLDGQQRRMLTLLKTSIVPSAAWTLALLFRRLRRPGSLRVPRVLLRATVLALVLLSVGRGLIHGISRISRDLTSQIPALTPGTPLPRRSNSNPDLEAAIAWLAEARAKDPSATPFRLAIHYPYTEPSHARVWGASYRMGIPVVDYNWMSAVFLGNRPREASVDGYLDWNVRFVLSISSTAPAAPADDLVLRFTKGQYKVYEFKKYDPSFVVAPPGVTISDVSRSGDSVSFTVAGAPADGADVRVRAGYLPRWQATVDGKSVDVAGVPPRAGAVARQDQIGVKARNGRVVVSADGPMPRGRLGMFLAFLGLVGLGVVLRDDLRARIEARVRHEITTRVAALREQFAARRARLTQNQRWGVVIGALAAISLSSVVVAKRGTRTLSLPPLEGIGFSARVSVGSAPPISCIPDPFQGLYHCLDGQTPVARIEGALGMDPAKDATGEFRILWSGIQVVTHKPAATDLTFGGVRTGDRKLALKFSTSGRWNVTLRAGAVSSPMKAAEGQGTIELELPEGAPSSGPLVVHMESFIPEAHIVLAGTMKR